MIHLRRAALAAGRTHHRCHSRGYWGQGRYLALRGPAMRVQALAPAQATAFHTCFVCAASDENGGGDSTGGKKLSPEDVLCVIAVAGPGFWLTGWRRRTLMGTTGLEDEGSEDVPMDPSQLGIDLENMDEDEVRALVEVRGAPPGEAPQADRQPRSTLQCRPFKAWSTIVWSRPASKVTWTWKT